MIELVASCLIVGLPVLLGALFTYCLWGRGWRGRVILLAVVCFMGSEVYALKYPQKQLKENYARVIS
ncbi:hypothetical protein CBP51_02805 [Cellvibrio mixtus]|jgi:hypothetical protein|uniref:Uncharacterized protein n=1 Tax=Cellvibrio mixtus TaxID=39650 RepID=A0A266Q7V6_9GAMM|nr:MULTISPECIES: hypothetical protein [Cellvibrio]AQT59982.1 hypothetical protein B0D95_07695 [Cellvibrio sp. PSBB023]OZY85977.1 hypothetical protein CBP51_02805 [Cellvibrio mixtus]